MKGYVVVDTEVRDTEAFAEFVAGNVAAVASNAGRYLVRTNDVEQVEGDWAPKRFVIIEFDSVEAARGFVAATYGAPDAAGRRDWTSRVLIAEGYDSSA